MLYAKFLVQFKRALPPPLRLSAAVGGFWKKSGTAPTKAAVNVDIATLKGSDVVLYSMDTCKCLQSLPLRLLACSKTRLHRRRRGRRVLAKHRDWSRERRAATARKLGRRAGLEFDVLAGSDV